MCWLIWLLTHMMQDVVQRLPCAAVKSEPERLNSAWHTPPTAPAANPWQQPATDS